MKDMRRIDFKLKVSSIDIHHPPAASPLYVDGVTKRGRAFRAEILIQPASLKLSDIEGDDLKKSVDELLGILISSGFSARDVNKMAFAISL